MDAFAEEAPPTNPKAAAIAKAYNFFGNFIRILHPFNMVNLQKRFG